MDKIINKLNAISIVTWVMFYCIFTDTIGQFIPIYFTHSDFRIPFYIVIFLVMIITVCISSYKTMYLPQKNNWIYSSLISLATTSLILMVFGIFTVGTIMSVWADASILYFKKNNSTVKIVSRYRNEGAFGGGTEPGDFEIVLKRPITPFLKMETPIDTNQIDKTKWIKKVYDKYDTVHLVDPD